MNLRQFIQTIGHHSPQAIYDIDPVSTPIQLSPDEIEALVDFAIQHPCSFRLNPEKQCIDALTFLASIGTTTNLNLTPHMAFLGHKDPGIEDYIIHKAAQ